MLSWALSPPGRLALCEPSGLCEPSAPPRGGCELRAPGSDTTSTRLRVSNLRVLERWLQDGD